MFSLTSALRVELSAHPRFAFYLGLRRHRRPLAPRVPGKRCRPPRQELQKLQANSW